MQREELILTTYVYIYTNNKYIFIALNLGIIHGNGSKSLCIFTHNLAIIMSNRSRSTISLPVFSAIVGDCEVECIRY